MIASPRLTEAPTVMHEYSHLDTIETARLRLRLFTPADFDGFYHLTRDPDVMRFIGEGEVLPREQIESIVTRIMETFHRRGYGRWAVEERRSERLTGYGGFAFGGEDVGVELVYLLGREFWGRGYAMEIGRACLRYGFEELRLDTIRAATLPGNLRSRRVLERLGMRFMHEGTHHEFPCVFYEMKRDDWTPDDDHYLVKRELNPWA